MSGPSPSSAARSEIDRALLTELLRRLDDGELDAAAPSSTTSRALAPLALLFRAIAGAKLGRREAARRDAMDATALAPGSPLIHLTAARVLLAQGDDDAGLALLENLAKRGGPTAAAALDVAFEAARKRGRWGEARRAIERAMAADPTSIERFVRAAGLFLAVGEDEAAFAAIEGAVSRGATGPGARLRGAALLVRLGRLEEAAAWVAEAVGAADDTAAVSIEGASILLDAGALDAASARCEEAIAGGSRDARALVMRASRALWETRLDDALEAASSALAADPNSVEAHRSRGAALLLRGDHEAALDALDRALALGDDREAWVWRAETLLAAGRDQEARISADRAREMSGDYPAAALVRMRIHLRLLDPRGPRVQASLSPYAYEELRGLLDAVCPGEDAALESGDPRVIGALLDRALARLGGNRSTRLTRLDGSSHRLVPLNVAASPRFAAKAAQWRIRMSPPEVVLPLFDRVLAAYPRSPLPHCYRGELHLWLGQVAEARADFERSLARDPLTRFAHLGLCAVCTLEGDGAAALAHAQIASEMMPRPAPPLYAYRGGAHRLAGNLAEALTDLTRAVEVTPSRISAWLLLGLVHHALGHDDEARAIHDRLETQASWLLHAAAETGSIARGTEPETRARLFEQALSQMRGNRSSTCVTYFSAGGQLSVVSPHPEPHSPEKELLAIRVGLSRAAGLSR